MGISVRWEGGGPIMVVYFICSGWFSEWNMSNEFCPVPAHSPVCTFLNLIIKIVIHRDVYSPIIISIPPCIELILYYNCNSVIKKLRWPLTSHVCHNIHTSWDDKFIERVACDAMAWRHDFVSEFARGMCKFKCEINSLRDVFRDWI